MNSCRNTGSTATALGPSAPSSVGTSRQPSTCCPSSATIRSKSASICRAARGVARQEDEPGAVLAAGRQRDAEPRRLLAQEPVRHLDEDAGAVAGVGLAAARAAVLQVDEHLQRLPHDRVRPAPLDVDDEADAAGVVLVAGIVETLGGWQS